MPYISKTPTPPYYAVVFTSINAKVDHTEHVEMYARLVQRAATYEGYLGIEPARNGDGTGVAKDPEHQVAKRKGSIFAESSASTVGETRVHAGRAHVRR